MSSPLLGDHSRRRVGKVDPRFIGTHARLAPSCRWLDISKQIALNMEIRLSSSIGHADHSTTDFQAGQRSSFDFTGPVGTACFAAWLMFPGRVRVVAYEMLQMVGHRLYGKPHTFETVQTLPFGLYLKSRGDPEGFRNEFNTL
ncbi:uncharacterized protein BP5553_03741 [Venustampulla echinocandica]|uniref:Uncharacterized protein n=1 Tax=Venustampulla echinocandica TaxID=2656787 RepID=A0A370TV47_9HELO|nr:uncharacterized protein BP5553_03741 [Venustampulla echinocandica]RDL39401.1 hypothetical protein BP5553_03741 [Venustampulla echinocandica]